MQSDVYSMNYHLMPPKGWLNDPNGLCFFKGMYHVFFQYSPDSPDGGKKYWGHYEGSDLTNWKYAGTPIAPDMPFDRSGAYSGSALITTDESGEQKMSLYYTGNVKLEGDYDYIETGREAYVVLTESSDAVSFSPKEVLLGQKDYPEDYTLHVRDPKVFEANGSLWMILGGRKRNGHGAAIIYRSEDGRNWSFERELEAGSRFGYMWECPDLFLMDGNWCFSFCPQGLEAEKYRFQNTDQSGYTVLKPGYEIDRDFVEWDMGFDFYAPQTFTDESGRRLLIGWAGLPELPYSNPTVEMGWQHCLTVPRKLEYRDGVIFQSPAIELNSLREKQSTWRGDISLTLDNFSFMMEIKNIVTDEWQLSLEENMFFKYRDGEFIWEFPESKSDTEDWGRGRRIRSMKLKLLENILILCDNSIVEIFINDGSSVMCGRFYPDKKDCNIFISGSGENAEGSIWNMKKMEVVSLL